MNDHELKELWRTQKLAEAPVVEASAQLEGMRTKMSQLHATLKARNFRELGAGAFVVIVFGIYFFLFPNPVMRIGSLIVIGGALFSAWKLFDSQRGSVPPDAGAPVAHWLQYERERVYQEAELLRTVLWWYILPIGLGTNVFFWGFQHLHMAVKIGFTGAALLMYAWIYRLNQVARRKQLLPVQDELEGLLEQEPNDGAVEENPRRAAAEKRSNFIAAGIILAITFAGVFLVRNSPRVELPRAPEFNGISSFDTNDVANVNAWLQEQVARAQFPSLSVAIIREGKIIYQGAFGYEDIKSSKRATIQTSYHVASVTKVFTASMAVMLDARGVIDLDQPVAKYFPEGVSISTEPEVGAKITLRQLASHTSGLPRGVPGEVQSVEGRYELEPKRLYDHLAKVELEFAPGTKELYSNFGFGLLGHALERAAGKPLDRLLQEMICEAMLLDSTGLKDDGKLRVATGYGSDVPRRAVEHSYRRRFAASGGLIASAPDLAFFLGAQMKPGFFTSAMLMELHTPTKLADGSLARTALGWTIRSNGKVGRILEKNGGRNNCGAWIGFSPEHGVGVAVVTNCGGPDVDPIGRWLLERAVPGGNQPVTSSE